MKVFDVFLSVLPAETVYAHCDIPCGIYDPQPAKIAAQTVQKMVTMMLDLAQTDAYKNGDVTAMQTMGRLVLVKEEHARKCKEDILVLWSDFFKPEDIQKFPDLHDTFWQTAKLVSKNKQSVDLELAKQLVAAVDKIASMFAETVAARAKK